MEGVNSIHDLGALTCSGVLLYVIVLDLCMCCISIVVVPNKVFPLVSKRCICAIMYIQVINVPCDYVVFTKVENVFFALAALRPWTMQAT